MPWLTMSINLKDIAILNNKCSGCYIISLISKNEVKDVMQNAHLTQKSGTL